MSGRIIHGRFEILGEIGHGGMGVIYRARQISLDRVVAVKMLSANLVDDEEFRERFRQEAQIIARLTHPNIVQVYDIHDVEAEEGGFYIVMEYVEGRSLREVLREAKTLPVESAVAIAEQVADGLAYAHGKGIIHRDIKPDNIMMLDDERVKIMDFGIARLRGSSINTQTGVCMGTPQFMSPEQAAGKPVDARSDLYSLAVVLYGMVTGELPFTGDSPVAIALKHIHEQPRRPSEVNSTVPPVLDSIILKAMAKRPQERYRNAEEFRQALSRFGSTTDVAISADGEETYVPSPVVPQSVASEPWDTPDEAIVKASPRRRRFSWAWLAAAVPGLIALAIILVFLQTDLLRPRREAIEPTFPKDATFTQLLTLLEDFREEHPGQLGDVIQSNEQLLREKASAEIRPLVLAGQLENAQGLRREAERVVFPHLTEEQRSRWITGLGGPADDKPGGQPWPRRERARSPNDTSEQPDPVRAKGAFAKAQETARQWEKETDPEVRSTLFRTCVKTFGESIKYDDENWRYLWGFAQFLATSTSQWDQSSGTRDVYLRLALQQIDRAKVLCPDSAERKKMEDLENSLRQQLRMPPDKP